MNKEKIIVVKIGSLHTNTYDVDKANQEYMEKGIDDSNDYEELLFLKDSEYSKLLDFIYKLNGDSDEK